MEENNTTPQVDTSLWSTPFTSPTQVDVTKSTMPFQNVQLPDILQMSPDNTSMIGSFRFDASNKMMGLSKGRNNILDIVSPDRNKLDLTREVALTDTHEKLNDGTWLPKYESYLPGVDNDTRMSQMQSGTEKFFNPLKRLFANTSLAGHDLAANFYGIGAAAFTGRFDGIYDNDYSKYVDDLTSRNNFDFKNYYNAVEREQDLGLNLQTWDKVLGGAEFTFRMLASEAILAAMTDGASLPSAFAKSALRGSRYADEVLSTGNKIAKMSKLATVPEKAAALRNVASVGNKTLDVLNNVSREGKIADGLVKARFAITSPMYEAGFEARHFQKEAEDQFWNYYKDKGTQPTDEEVNNFSDKLKNASNGVFMTNMAILAPSNLAMVGDFVNIKNPLAKLVTGNGDFLNKNLFKLGTEVGKDGTYQAMKAGFWNKALAFTAPVIKGGLIEGVYEEGSQGIASSTYKNYVASSYDPEAMKNTANYIDAFSKSFEDQFSTKEGSEEIIIGALIGGLMGGVGGVRNNIREYAKQDDIAQIQNTGTEFAENFKSNVYTNEQLLSLFSNGNRYQNLREKIDQADQSGDNLEKASLQAQSFVSLLDAYHSVGKGEEFIDMMQNVFAGIDNQYISDNTGLNIDQVEDFKKEQIQNINELSEKYSTALEAGRYLFGNSVGGFTEVDGKQVNGQNLSNALAFASTMATFHEKFAGETFDAFQQKLAQLSKSPETIEKFGVLGTLMRMSEVEKAQYYDFNGQITSLKGQLAKLTDQIARLNAKKESSADDILKRDGLANKMQLIQSQLNEVTARKDVLWKSSVDNFYASMNKTGYVPQIELENFTEQVKEIRESLDNPNFSPDNKLVLTQLLNQFDKANESYKSFADLSNKLTDPKFTVKTYNQLFGKLRAKGKSINDHTKDTLLSIYNYNSEIQENANETFNTFVPNVVITEEVLNSTENPSEDTVSFVKDKIENGKSLSENEIDFYNKHKDTIDKYQTLDKTDPINSTSPDTLINDNVVKRNALEKELTDLENGIYSEELQKKIDKIAGTDNQSQIDEINKKRLEELRDNLKLLKTEELRRPNGSIGTQGFDPTQMKDLIKFIATELNITIPENLLNRNDDSLKSLIEFLKNDENIKNRIVEFVKENPSETLTLPDDTVVFKDGNHRANLLNLLESDIIPTIDQDIKNEINLRYDGQIESINSENENGVVQEIEQEKINLEDQIAKLNGEISNAEKIERLENEIQELKVSLMENLSFGEEEINIIENFVDPVDQHFKNMTADEITAEKNKAISQIRKPSILRRMFYSDKYLTKVAGGRETIYGDSVEEVKGYVEDYYSNIDNTEEVSEQSETSNTDFESQIRRLNILETELRSLKQSERQNFNPDGSPLEQLEWVINNINDLEFENVDDISNAKKPSQEEVDEYIGLINTRNKNTAQKKRISELREKLLSFNIMEGLAIDGVNILEVVDNYNQSKNIKSLNEEQNNELPEDTFKQIVNQSDMEASSSFPSPKVGLNYDGSYIKAQKNGYKIHHVKLATFLQRALEEGSTPTIIVYKRDSKGNKSIKEEILVTEENIDAVSAKYDSIDDIKIDLLEDTYLIKYKGDNSFYIAGDINNVMNLIEAKAYAITGQPTNYVLLYDTNIDGTMQPRVSEFQVMSDGVEILFDKEVLNSLKPGDKVTLEFDPNDSYNKSLKSNRHESEGNIYVKKNGKLVNILKASNTEKSDAGWTELQAVRKKVLNSTEPVEISIEGSYLGFPIISLNSDGTAREVPIDESKVIGYGYMDENGNLQGDIKDMHMDNIQYITPLSTMGKKSPVMIFEAYGKNIAFPINIKPEGVDLRSEVDDIMNNQDLSRERKVFELNNLLESHGMLNESLASTNVDLNVENIKNALETVYDNIDLTDQSQIENADKTAYVDLNDPFKSAKLIFDFGSIVDEEIDEVGKAVQETVIQTVSTPNNIGSDIADENTCP